MNVRSWRFPAEIAALQKQAFTVCVRLVQRSTSFRGPRFSPGSALGPSHDLFDQAGAGGGIIPTHCAVHP